MSLPVSPEERQGRARGLHDEQLQRVQQERKLFRDALKARVEPVLDEGSR